MITWLNRLLYGEGLLFAKGDQENTMGAIASQRKSSQDAMNPYQMYTSNRIGTKGYTDPNGKVTPGTGLQGQQQSQLDTASKGYAGFAGTGGVSDEATSGLGNGAGSIANGIKAPDYSAAATGYGNMAATGGVNLAGDQQTFAQQQQPNADMTSSINGLKNIDYSGVDSSINSLKNLSATGGFTDADKANVLRPLYYEYEKTGGYTPDQLANIKKESNSVIPSYYSSMQDSLDRQKATSGYGPGFSDANQALIRQGATASGDQALKTDVGLAESVRQGRMSAADAIQKGQLGISGIANPIMEESAAAGANAGLAKTSQQSANLVSSGNMADQMAQLKLAAANGDVNAQRLIQSGMLAGLGGMVDTTNLADQSAQSKARLASSNLTSLAGMQQQGKEFGVAGQKSLYDSTTGQLSDEEKNYLTSLGMSADQQARLLQIMAGTATQPGSTATAFGNIFSGMGAVAGGLTGIGNLSR